MTKINNQSAMITKNAAIGALKPKKTADQSILTIR